MKRVPWQAQFVLLAAIWGASFVFIKLGVEAFQPLQVALGRMLFGIAVLLVIVIVKGDRLPAGLRVWGHLAVTAVFLNTIPFTLFAWGETRVSSVVAGISQRVER